MTIRIPWDEQETAILIEACIAVNEGNKTKKEAIKEVSETLRKRAIDKGLTIVEMFRNENGITMQFMLINELLTQENAVCVVHLKFLLEWLSYTGMKEANMMKF